ncbi:MAG: sigma-70 family RNA polymerase sigma factor [Phycisphaeraceae bacterium]|nr:sigma-70 family RNA polymerase sigma factor [Phycisphaeraceae bacterium]
MYAQTTTHGTLLARLSGGGDSAAWREFCERYEELIRSFARRRGLSASDCDDVLQDVMLALTKAMPGFRYDPAKGKFRSYLKTVTLHAILRKSRQEPAGASLSLGDGSVSRAIEDETEDTWEAEWRQYHLRTAMKTIRAEFNAADLEAFDRYGVGGEEASAVAKDLSLSIDQVYQAKSRVLKRLSQVIAKQVEEEG